MIYALGNILIIAGGLWLGFIAASMGAPLPQTTIAALIIAAGGGLVGFHVARMIALASEPRT